MAAHLRRVRLISGSYKRVLLFSLAWGPLASFSVSTSGFSSGVRRKGTAADH